MRTLFFILFTLISLVTFCQSLPRDTSKYENKIVFMKKVVTLIHDSLNLKIGDDFYTKFSENDSMFSYVYVSRKDTISKVTDGSFIYFGNHPNEAKINADSFTKAGFDVMVYQTAGTSGAFISKRLLEYEDISIAFIMIHEAMHRHIANSHSAIPYEFEESIGDVIANSFCGWFSGASVKSYFDFAFRNEEIYTLINKCSKGKIAKEKCDKKIKAQLKDATLFQKDRFYYTVNNAYLLRNSFYTKRYFQLRELYQEIKNPKLFIEEMMKLPAGLKECDEMILVLKKKY
jgi:hypothetical protein